MDALICLSRSAAFVMAGVCLKSANIHDTEWGAASHTNTSGHMHLKRSTRQIKQSQAVHLEAGLSSGHRSVFEVKWLGVVCPSPRSQALCILALAGNQTGYCVTASMAYTVRLDQNKAKELARTGASLLLLNVPEGTRIGIDHQVGLECN